MPLRRLVSLCLLVLLAGCAGRPTDGPGGAKPPVMTVSDFYAFCSALPTPGGCLSDPLCLRYKSELASPPPDLAGCLALCRQTENALYLGNLTNGCSDILDRASDLCDQFCRRREVR